MQRWGLPRRLVGLEITCTKLRVAYRHSGAITAHEFELPIGAIDNGRIEDAQAITDSLRELWKVASLPTRRVALGIPNHDIVTRLIDLPDLPERDLVAAARWELADMIPFPIAETVIDVRRVATISESGSSRARVLVVAGYAATLRSYLSVVRQAGLRVQRIDVTPLALVRAVAAQLPLDGTVAVVQIDRSGVMVVVTTDGVVSFTRAVETVSQGSAGRELEAELAVIEQYRHRAHHGGAALAANTDPIIESLRGSLEYYKLQPDVPPIERVLIAGQPEMVEQVAPELASLLDVGVTVVDPVGDGAPSGRSTSTQGAALGLTISSPGGLTGPSQVNLLPGRSTASQTRLRMAAAGGSAILTGVLLTGVGAAVGPDSGTVSAEVAASEQRIAALQAQLAEHGDTLAAVQDLRQRVTRAQKVSGSRTAWHRLVQEIRATMPQGASVLAISGNGPVQTEAGEQGSGSLEIVAQASDLAAASRWLTALTGVRGLADPWLSDATSDRTGGTVTFTLTAQLDEDSVILPTLDGVEL